MPLNSCVPATGVLHPAVCQGLSGERGDAPAHGVARKSCQIVSVMHTSISGELRESAVTLQRMVLRGKAARL